MKLIKREIRIGSTKHIILGTQADANAMQQHVAKLIDALKPNGDGAQFEDGSATWLADIADIDTNKSGSDQYVWDKSGNRVRHTRCRVTRDAAGQVTKQELRKVYARP